MKNMSITFLGTSDAFPTEKRNHAAILIGLEGEQILVDCGEGTQRQFKIAKLNPNKLTKLLITHLHGDHVFGLPGLFATLSMSEYQKKLEIYGPPGIKNHISVLEKLYGRFKIEYDIKESHTFHIESKEYLITSLPMRHTLPTNAYSISIKAKRRIKKEKLRKLKVPNTPQLQNLQQGKDIVVNGKKLSAKLLTYLEPEKKITIILDTKINENMIKLAKDSSLLISESTYASEEEKYAAEHYHLTSSQAATVAKKAKVKQLLLTHLAQRYESQANRIELEAKKIFKNTKVAKDFDTFVI